MHTYTGIKTFVYSRRQPFDADKLAVLVETLPFIASVAAPLRLDKPKGSANTEGGPFDGLLRSKGFLWVSGEDDVAYFWSQVSLYKILFYFKTLLWESIIHLPSFPTYKAFPIAILLHNHCATYAAPPTPL